MGLRLLKVNLPRVGLVGLGVGVTFPSPGSLLVVTAVEIRLVSVTVLRRGLALGVVLVEVGLSGVVGEIKPWMVLETRAETVTRLESGVVEPVEVSEETPELVAARCDFVPFRDVFTEPV